MTKCSSIKTGFIAALVREHTFCAGSFHFKSIGGEMQTAHHGVGRHLLPDFQLENPTGLLLVVARIVMETYP